NNWNNFLTSYDDTFLQELSQFGSVDSSDLSKTIASLKMSKNSTATSSTPATSSEFEQVASLIISSLIPSIASSVNDKIATISKTLKDDPELITSKQMEKEIKRAIALRIALDKESVNLMVQSLDGLVNKLSHQIITLMEKSDVSNKEIKLIKSDLESLDIESSDFKVTHTKLFNIANTLEQKTELFSKDLVEHSTKVQEMATRIKTLEDELAESQKTSREDFLTKLYNKRAIDEFLKIKEDEYVRHGHEYALVMFDIDFFKKVNDVHGHDAGDAVLSGVAAILKKLCRKSDVVGRYGGEEFIAIISDTNNKGAEVFANKINKQVQSTKFMYKSTRIDVTISGGIANRSENPSLKQTFKHADEKLYIAKKNGRNQIVS
ncbi:MAG: diguanylate cyclase, partial [Campylobacterota bacterium]|nr:diguanylate cyclase [Campylobacterota bacterium]